MDRGWQLALRNPCGQSVTSCDSGIQRGQEQVLAGDAVQGNQEKRKAGVQCAQVGSVNDLQRSEPASGGQEERGRESMFLGRAWKRSWCLELGVSRSTRQECWCASGVQEEACEKESWRVSRSARQECWCASGGQEEACE